MTRVRNLSPLDAADRQRRRAEVGTREHRHDARQLHRRGGVDYAEPCVGEGTSHEGSFQEPGKLDVVEVGCLAAEKADVLPSGTGRPTQVIGPGSPPTK